MDSDLKQHLEAMEERLKKRIDESSNALEDRLKKHTDESVRASEDRLVERMRDTETTLLTEFHKWASPMDTRVRASNAMIRAFDADLEYIQDRLKKLENRPAGT